MQVRLRFFILYTLVFQSLLHQSLPFTGGKNKKTTAFIEAVVFIL